MPRRRGVWWLTLGPDPYLATCQRCGAHEPQPSMPLLIPAFIAYCKYLAEKHRFCRPAAPETPKETP